MFTSALSSFSDAWNDTYGTFTDRSGWNASVVKTFGQRMSGVADTINNIPYSLGYLTPANALEVNLPYAMLMNKRGNIVDGGKISSVESAIDAHLQVMSARLDGSLVDSDDPDAYPIAGYSYFLIHTNIQSTNCSSAMELCRYIEWFLTSDQAHLGTVSSGMVPITESVVEKIQKNVLERMTCNGVQLKMLVDQAVYEELESLKTWKVPCRNFGSNRNPAHNRYTDVCSEAEDVVPEDVGPE